MSFVTTPNMDLELPNVLQEPGPTWANDLNASLTTIDSHNHTTGKGVTVPLGGSSPGATVVGTVNFNGLYAPINQLYSNFTPTTVPTTLPNDTVFTNNATGKAELWYKDSSGVAYALTSNGGIASNIAPTLPGFAYNSAAPSWIMSSSTVATTYADSIALNFWSINSSGSNKVLVSGTGLAPSAGSPTTPTGGWSLGNASGSSFQLRFDTAGTGSYTTQAVNVQVPASPFNNQYYTSFNALSGTAPGAPLDVYLEPIANVGVAVPMLRTNITLSGAGAAPAGFGTEILFQAATTGSNSTNYSPTGAIDSVWNNVASRFGSVFIRGATGGVLTATPGITVTNFGAGDAVGINGAAVVGQTLTLYGGFYPSATATFPLGASGAVFSNVFTRIVTSDTTLALASASGITVNTQLAPAGSPVSLGTSNNPWSVLIVDDATTSNGASGNGAYLASAQRTPSNALDLTNRHRGNNLVAFGVVGVSGTTPTLSANSWNVSSVTRSAQGVYVAALQIPVNANCTVITSLFNNTTTTTVVNCGSTTNGSSVTVTIQTGAGGVDLGFQFMVVGPPGATP